MGHNSVVSSHPKSIGNLLVYGLSTRPLGLGRHIYINPGFIIFHI